MQNLSKFENLARGILVVGGSQEDINQIKEKCINDYKAQEASFPLDSNPEVYENLKSGMMGTYSMPEADRVYKVIHVNQAVLKGNENYNSVLASLISESRPLRIIFVLEVSDFSKIDESLKMAILGNVGNVILFKTENALEVLESRNISETDAQGKIVFSYLDSKMSMQKELINK